MRSLSGATPRRSTLVPWTRPRVSSSSPAPALLLTTCAPPRSSRLRCWSLDTRLQVVFVTTEVAPWSKSGGLADVLSGLPAALAARGHRVMTVSPRYAEYADAIDSGARAPVAVGSRQQPTDTVRPSGGWPQPQQRQIQDGEAAGPGAGGGVLQDSNTQAPPAQQEGSVACAAQQTQDNRQDDSSSRSGSATDVQFVRYFTSDVGDGVEHVFIDHPLFRGASAHDGGQAAGLGNCGAPEGVYTYTAGGDGWDIQTRNSVLCQAALAAPVLLWPGVGAASMTQSALQQLSELQAELQRLEATAAAQDEQLQKQDLEQQGGGIGLGGSPSPRRPRRPTPLGVRHGVARAASPQPATRPARHMHASQATQRGTSPHPLDSAGLTSPLSQTQGRQEDAGLESGRGTLYPAPRPIIFVGNDWPTGLLALWHRAGEQLAQDEARLAERLASHVAHITASLTGRRANGSGAPMSAAPADISRCGDLPGDCGPGHGEQEGLAASMGPMGSLETEGAGSGAAASTDAGAGGAAPAAQQPAGDAAGRRRALTMPLMQPASDEAQAAGPKRRRPRSRPEPAADGAAGLPVRLQAVGARQAASHSRVARLEDGMAPPHATSKADDESEASTPPSSAPAPDRTASEDSPSHGLGARQEAVGPLPGASCPAPPADPPPFLSAQDDLMVEGGEGGGDAGDQGPALAATLQHHLRNFQRLITSALHGAKFVLAIHNLAYQGLFSARSAPATGLPLPSPDLLPTLLTATPDDAAQRPDSEADQDAVAKGGDGVRSAGGPAAGSGGDGSVSCISWLQAALLTSDLVITVSPQYAQEIMTQAESCATPAQLTPPAPNGHVAGSSGAAQLVPATGVRPDTHTARLMEGVRTRGVLGIMNGIDAVVWSPSEDRFLPFSLRYGQHNVHDKKAAAKALLQSRLGLDMDPGAALVAFVGRLEEQKGADVLLAALPHVLGSPSPDVINPHTKATVAGGGRIVLRPHRVRARSAVTQPAPKEPDAQAPRVQVVMLGAGQLWQEECLEQLAVGWSGRACGHAGFNEPLAHLLMAAADFLVVPSRFEPCGLVALCAVRYGTVPIVTPVGGLPEAVAALPGPAWPASPLETDVAAVLARQAQAQLGFVLPASPPPAFDPNGMHRTAARELAAVLRGAAAMLGTPPARAMRERCMAQDVSWASSAAKWEEALQRLVRPTRQAAEYSTTTVQPPPATRRGGAVSKAGKAKRGRRGMGRDGKVKE